MIESTVKLEVEVEPKIEPEVELEVEPKIELEVEPKIEPEVELEVELEEKYSDAKEDLNDEIETRSITEKTLGAGTGIDISSNLIVEKEDDSTSKMIAEMIIVLKTKIGFMKISVDTVHIVVKEGIELVEKYNYPGATKRKHVVRIVRQVIIDLVEDEDKERLILDLVNSTILENTIDLVVMASNGKLNINNEKMQKKVVKCIQSCIPFTINLISQIVEACKSNKKKENA